MDIALKVTYNDGNPDGSVGFKGICSTDVIKQNVTRRVNCGLKTNPCRIYYDNDLKGEKPKDVNPCYESALFLEWEFGAGKYHSGPKVGQPIPIRSASANDIAVLTTVKPGKPESERKIIGIFRIGNIDDSRIDTHGHMIVSQKVQRLELTEDVAEELNFWFYYTTPKRPNFWGEGLFRILEEGVADNILSDLLTLEVDPGRKEIIHSMLSKPISEISKKKKKNPAINKVITRKKYGSGGEGPEHKALKNWIAENPDFLGLTNVEETENDIHTFPSQDRPDIVFKLADDKWATVEIETNDPLPGAYQAIKYRDLLCAENTLPLNSDNVRTFLVAYSFDTEIKDFCKRYNIEIREKIVPL